MRRLGLAALLVCCGGAEAAAQVVALGASSTLGRGVSPSDSYPAQLETLLRKRGINVHVANQGISGDTTIGMSNRLNSAVPDGTRVVVFQPSGNNDARHANHGTPVDTAGNIRTIVARLRAHHIAVVAIGPRRTAKIAVEAGASYCGRVRQGVTSQHMLNPSHMDATGYAILAARLVPCVMRALRRR